ncbi:unnamed protein product, partial [Angiostrongylus costaricensis]|uniref:FDF domain-containing protein n=1 Tax=Angiostrongylus costaricensis TaxID=334426 RepID=A0A0R3PJS6_ANGCS
VHSGPVPVSETPRFRRFEPQAPFPKDVVTGKVKNRRPSGNPLLDSKKLRGKVASVNNELIKPIDFDLLNTDFDFDANLEKFKKEDFDDEYYETVEKQKISQNFAHYENIIDDPDRCISWTNMCGNNGIIGRVDVSSKSATERFVTSYPYLHDFRFGISLENVVVLASRSTSSRLIDRILFHLDNRRYRFLSFLI